MKKLFCSFIIIICALCLFSCSEKLTAKIITDADGNAVATGYYDSRDNLIYEEQTDEKGVVIKKTSYDKKGNVTLVEDYENGKKKLETAYSYNGSDGDYTMTVTSYDSKEVMVSVKETVYKDARPAENTFTLLSAQGEYINVEKSTYTYQKDGSVLTSIFSNGKKIRETLDDGNGIVISDHEIFESGESEKNYYNESGAVIRSESYGKDEKLTNYTVTAYNDQGKILRTQTYDAKNALVSASSYFYKNDGVTLEKIQSFDKDGNVIGTITYDEKGNPVYDPGN